MAKWTGTIIGGGIGWAFGGPLGAIIGAYVGSMFSGENISSRPASHPYRQQNRQQPPFYTTGGDFAIAMLSLFAHVSRADNQVVSSEVQYVKKFLVDKFGNQNARELMQLYKEILKKDFNIYEVTAQIKANMDYYARLEMLHILFGIAGADGKFETSEISAIESIARGLEIGTPEYESIKAIFIKKDNFQAYTILGVHPNDDKNTIKKAYRNLANQYHPDKVATLGPEFQKMAEEKFKSINDAYQEIRKQRGF